MACPLLFWELFFQHGVKYLPDRAAVTMSNSTHTQPGNASSDLTCASRIDDIIFQKILPYISVHLCFRVPAHPYILYFQQYLGSPSSLRVHLKSYVLCSQKGLSVLGYKNLVSILSFCQTPISPLSPSHILEDTDDRKYPVPT